MRIELPTHYLAYMAALACLISCGSQARRAATPAELARALSAAESLEIQLPAGELGGLRERVEAAARTLSERRALDVRVLASDAVGAVDVPRVVLGTLQDPRVRELLVGAGAREDETGSLVWNGCALRAGGDLLRACFEDPMRPGLPLNLLVGFELDDLRGVCEDLLPSARPCLRWAPIDRPGLDIPITSAGAARAPAAVTATPIAWENVRRRKSYRVRRAPGVTGREANSYANQVDAALAVVAQWAGEELKGRREVFLVADGETRRALDGAGRASYVVAARGLAHDSGASVARAVLRETLGEPCDAWMLDAASIDAAGAWWGRPLRDWGRVLVELGLVPDGSQIFRAGAIDEHSQHIIAPLRGLLWRHWRESYEAQELSAIWRAEREPRFDRERFCSWLEAHESGLESLSSSSRAARRAQLQANGFQRGISFASNVRLGGGFDGARLSESLRAARSDRVSALSVTSFFDERALQPGAPGGTLALGRECVEGDLALAQLFAAARARGIEALALRPRLLLSDSAGLSQHLRRTSLEHWEEFFASYEPMAVHYALLAELCGVDLLFLGGDLAPPEAQGEGHEPVRAYRHSELRLVIERVRQSFGGALSYAATWPSEARRFQHWDALDYVGVSWFPNAPARSVVPRDEPLLRADYRNQLTQIAELAHSVGKPWLVLEFGARATEGGTRNTLLGPGRANPQPQADAVRALGIVIDTLAKAERAPAGFYWWCWSANPDAGEVDPRGYSLQGQPGEAGWLRIGRGL